MSMIPAVYPLTLRIAADARTGHTTSADDHVWEVALGQDNQPALALQTQYGGRVGLLRFVPMVRLQGQVVYEAQQLASPAKLVMLAPDAVRLEAELVAGLKMAFYAWVMHSQVVGGSLIFTNKTKQPISLTAELMAQAMREKPAVRMSWLSLETPQGAAVGLSLGQLGDLQPVLLMENASENPSSKLSSPLTVPAGKTVAVRFTAAASTNIDKSLEEAYLWLYHTDWGAHLKGITQRLAKLPTIETGDELFDAAVALTQQTALRSVINKSPAYVRTPSSRTWTEENGLDTYQLATTLAPLDVNLVKGFIKNQPLSAPFLAQLTKLVYEYSQDQKFVEEMYPRLIQSYATWFAHDADQDGFPEWKDAQNPLAPLIESPDLAAYLLNEGQALATLAEIGNQQKAWKELEHHHEKLKNSLQESWQGNQFIYRERDSHQPMVGEVLFKSKGDFNPPAPIVLTSPHHLIIQIEGAANKPKLLRVQFEGIDKTGKQVSENLEGAAFNWYRAKGSAITQTIWQRIDSLVVEGLSRVVEYQVKTPDFQQRDLSLLLPYATDSLTDGQYKAILKALKETYWRNYGLAAVETPLPDGLENRMNLPLITMLGLALLEKGEVRTSADLFENVTAAQIKALKEQGGFFQWYDANSGIGLGFQEHTSGLVPLHWLIELIGVRVIDGGTVALRREFGLKKKVKITHHGVKIARSNRKLMIKFPSGHTVELPADASSQMVTDPNYRPISEKIVEPAVPPRTTKPRATTKIPLSNEGTE